MCILGLFFLDKKKRKAYNKNVQLKMKEVLYNYLQTAPLKDSRQLEYTEIASATWSEN